ncbi:hypothetical protein B5P44_00905 [Mycobacterium sp. CBMA 213]|uniref:Uncharacterized protein n=1 Tax=Mycolicibacterium sp. CBMA 213 TaxID=1968788 RepID=A0A343VRG8_9MYCO|nr:MULTISPECIES: hypothetical protein [unclassified Mycolicibacterium]AVN58492.1 hypothetical protein B5P44_p00197 [Mycolicibacterium sp. CBMA 213]MUL61141.1 hypothetical protein [Mycolicibacterium sp. CBMA 335]MUM03379.1 hypothetical protein [Mycolicibacterium sp. CBMA 213]
MTAFADAEVARLQYVASAMREVRTALLAASDDAASDREALCAGALVAYWLTCVAEEIATRYRQMDELVARRPTRAQLQAHLVELNAVKLSDFTPRFPDPLTQSPPSLDALSELFEPAAAMLRDTVFLTLAVLIDRLHPWSRTGR